MPKQKTHKLTVTVRFDRPVTKAEAAREFRDVVHGEFYPGTYSDAEEMTVKGARPSREPA